LEGNNNNVLLKMEHRVITAALFVIDLMSNGMGGKVRLLGLRDV
jgi:hypothetical protein